MELINKEMISCILPTYNRQDRLKERIIEIQLQTYTEWELIIVDDGSTDNTEEVVKLFLISDPRIKYIKLPINSGSVSIPRNIGISHAEGEFIAHIDDDVIQLPHKLETLVTMLQNTPGAILALGDRINFMENEKFTELKRVKTTSQTEVPLIWGVDGGQFIYRNIYNQTPFIFPRWACDWYTAMMLRKMGNFVYKEEVVCIYIWHKTNRSNIPETKEHILYPTKYLSYFNPQYKFITQIPGVVV
jgi:glycosyltransferase involved in cell wall biosynthesis